MARVLLLVLALALAAGCGGEEAAGPGTAEPAPTPPGTGATTETGAATETEPETVAEPGRTSLVAYFLRDATVAPAARTVARTEAVARAALGELLAGPTEEERGFGLETSIPPGNEVARLEIAGSTAAVELTFAPDRRAAAQIVFTLTQFPTVDEVRIDPLGEVYTRDSFDALFPPILVEHPAVGATVTSPVTVRGSAMVFEATVLVTVTDGEGRILAEEVATATEGAPQRGDFEVAIPFDVERAQLGAVIAAAPNAAGGPPQHAFEVPVRLSP